MSHIIVPGKGVMPVGMAAASKAVEEYDESLLLGHNPYTNEWVVYKKRPVGEEPHPVFMLHQGSEPPSREMILEKLTKADVRRNGARIVEDLLRHNDSIKAKTRAEASDAAGEVAEYYAMAQRKYGQDPFPKIFVPKGVKSVERSRDG